MALYTVIRTSHVDDYKRPATDTYAVATTADYNEAVTVAANAWLEEFQSDFVYDNDCDSPFIDDVKAMLSDEPSCPGILKIMKFSFSVIS